MNELFDKLGLSRENGLYFLSEKNWRGILSKRVEEGLIRIIKPDAFFLFNNEPFILFFQNPINKQSIFKNCWNFNQAPVIFIISDNQIEIYNGFSFLKEEKRLGVLTDNKNISDFQFFNIVSGRTWEKYKSELSFKNRVDEYLLKNLESIKINLLNKHNIPNTISNNLIGRTIFIRYLIDRNVQIGFHRENNGYLTNNHFCSILESKHDAYRLFKYVQEKFNGNLFPVSNNESESVPKGAFDELINLLKGVEISTGQMSFFDIYDFSIIPIELVSNVYEFFIGKELQVKRGAYYTPLFLVNYILNETITQYFAERPNEYNCPVLDPACGSGVFLVETLRKIINQYHENEPDCRLDLNSYQNKLRNILTYNIFGIDKDENAINVAIFSLYVTLLDYLQPPEIINFTFPDLLNRNFYVADFFDTDHFFNNILGDGNKRFQFIIGNPPWGRIDDSVRLYEKYWHEREKSENSKIKVTDKQIAQAFLIRISDFKFSECGFIITSKIFYNLNAEVFRKYFLDNFKIRKIFELSSVRHEVFDKSQTPSICPSSVIFYNYNPEPQSNRNNIVTHISLKPNRFFELFKLFLIEKNDLKEVPQSFFYDYDWIWKVLVYGGTLDFNFIKRLKDNMPLNKIIGDKEKFIYGKGVCIKGGDKNEVSQLTNISYYIDALKKDLQPFHINYRSNEITKYDFIHRTRDIRLFRAPFLLIKKGVSADFKVNSAVSLKDAIFTDTYTSIKCFDTNNVPFLKSLSGIFNSTFFTYYLLLTASSIGIEREQTHDKKEKFEVPIPFNLECPDSEIVSLVTHLETLLQNQSSIENKKSRLSTEYRTNEIEISELWKRLELSILRVYKVTTQEKYLIDYAIEISIPLIRRENTKKLFNKVQFKSSSLKEYIQVFLNHFNVIFNQNGLNLVVEILYSSYAIGIYFRVRENNEIINPQIKWIQTADSNLILNRITSLSYKEFSQRLFTQKDIKGFEEDGFYIVKPNEFKCWHPALAFMDVNEFVAALIKSGKSTYEPKC